MPFSLGKKTNNTGFLKVESHKLMNSFEVAASNSVKKGQPVKFNATGEVLPAAAEQALTLIIGYALFDAEAGEQATIVMRASSIVFMQASVALNPTELITYNGFDATTGYNRVKKENATAANQIGWALEVASNAGDIILVALFN
jgi:hypothetical protein